MKDGDYPLLSEAIKGGLFHPRCKDSTSTYYEGITTLKPVSREELQEMEEHEELETKQKHAQRQVQRFKRREKYSLDPDNKHIAGTRKNEWQEKSEELAKQLENFDNNTAETIAKSSESGIIKIGAQSGARKTTGWQDRHGKLMYEEIRHRSTYVKKIADNTPFKESAIYEIKQHMFFKEHKFSDGSVRRFDYDFEQAQAWDRLTNGQGTESDLLLLKHEYVELTNMRIHGYDYETAHAIANKYHNWAKALLNEVK